MRAKVTAVFNGRPDDEPLTRRFRPGDVVTGDLARVAVREGLAEEIAEGVEAVPEDRASALARTPRRRRKSGVLISGAQ